MKTIITIPFTIMVAVAFAVAIALVFGTGCLVTGNYQHDGKTGVATIGISHDFAPKMRADAKRVVPLE